ncbi:glycosyltransferase 87 family protein [Streptomyces sp. NPDC057638]|uniref:glycosyltransferase 87 family protein n=1 Tax=Streptomyces sp. NPDC057638 TaxID=3346190 RepID=UPI0036A435EF
MASHRITPLPPAHHLSAVDSPTGGRDGRGHAVALAAVWTVTRLGMLALLLVDQLGDAAVAGEVHALYRSWYERLIEGSFPVGDATWQYPPGAASVFLAPALLPWLTYFQAFVVLLLLCDAVITLALARAGIRGAWLWVGALPLLLNLPFARYDLPVTAVAVLALLALRGRPHLAGALAAIGATLKVWPVLTLLGTPRGRVTRIVWFSAAASAVVLLTTVTIGFRHTLSFLEQQRSRGVQIESLGGSVLQFARQLGWSGEVGFQYGAFEVLGPHVTAVARLSLVLSAAALCWLGYWRIRARRWSPATPLDAAFTALLLFTVTSRVISPQYLIWLLGLAAVCLTSRHTCQRPVALLMVPAAALSALAFPLLYDEVISGSAVGCLVLLLRNALLATATVLACRRLWLSTV